MTVMYGGEFDAEEKLLRSAMWVCVLGTPDAPVRPVVLLVELLVVALKFA